MRTNGWWHLAQSNYKNIYIYVSSSLYLNDFQRFFFPNRLRRLPQTSMFPAMRSDFCLLAEACLPWEMPLTNAAGHLSQPWAPRPVPRKTLLWASCQAPLCGRATHEPHKHGDRRERRGPCSQGKLWRVASKEAMSSLPTHWLDSLLHGHCTEWGTHHPLTFPGCQISPVLPLWYLCSLSLSLQPRDPHGHSGCHTPGRLKQPSTTLPYLSLPSILYSGHLWFY